MPSRSRARFAVLATALLIASIAGAGEKKPDHSAVKPVPREGIWLKRHQSFVERAKKGDVDVLFLGDSITQGWEGNGKEIWKERFEPLKAANFGIGGDRTQHVLWRIAEGLELEGIHPRVAVLLIGTNNLSLNSNAEIIDGITAILKEIQRQRPQTRILLLGIFPRGARATDRNRERIKEINQELARLEIKQVRFLDIGDKFLEKDGELSRDIMNDGLHLTRKGYGLWADAIKGPLEELLKK